MAPLPPESTARFKVHYLAITRSHVLDIRWGGSPAALGTVLNSILSNISSLLFTFTVGTVEFAAAGSVFFNPVITGLEGAVFGGVGGTYKDNANYINFIGRSPGGRRVRLAFFGANSLAGDYRYVAGESAVIGNAISDLNNAVNPFMAIDGQKPIWKSYANAGVNAYWQKALRP